MKLLITVLLLFTFGQPLAACECVQNDFVTQAHLADQIFIGRVLRKTATDRVRYTFQVEEIFKGEKADSVIVETGFGFGDCGVVFAKGDRYVVFASNGKTSRCRPNNLIAESPDLGKLRYLFDSAFAAGIGKDDNRLLTNNEAVFFTNQLSIWRTGRYNFKDKRVAFFLKGKLISKADFFNNWALSDTFKDYIVIEIEEEADALNCDVVFLVGKNKKIVKAFKKKSRVKKLSKYLHKT